MAISKCLRESCGKNSFEMKELKVQKSAYKLMAIQCSFCGAVVSVTEFYNIGNAVTKIAEKLGIQL